MSDRPSVVLSMFSDEAANRRTALEQLSVVAALGLSYYSPRFIDVTDAGKIKHVTELDKQELKQLKQLQDEFGVKVASIGSRLGKVKLLDQDDGSHNRFVPFKDYLKTDVAATIDVANALGARFIRGFSFYHPRGQDPAKYVNQAAELIGKLADECAKHNLVYLLEVEANLVGQNGRMMAALTEKAKRPNILCIFDGGNISSQNMHAVQCFDEYAAMRKHMGWAHIKDYRIDPKLVWHGVVDEERLRNFVPADIGDSGHEAIFRDLKDHLPKLSKRMQKFGAPGFFLELEPHLKGGGQFGGFSGPDGMGVAVRALCSLLDYLHIDYQLRTMSDIRAARGF